MAGAVHLSYSGIQRTLLNHRNKQQHRPGGDIIRYFHKFAEHVTSIECPAEVLQGNSGQPLQANRIHARDGSLLLVFDNPLHTVSLSDSRWIFADGTFDAIPTGLRGLRQLVTLLAMKNDKVLY